MRSSVESLRVLAAVAAVGCMMLINPGPASAARPTGVPCDASALATAITKANAGTSPTVTLAANCTYSIAVPFSATDGLPVITGHVTLQGGLGTVIERDAVAQFRLLEVAAGGSLTVNSVTFENGNTAGIGGAIQSAGTLNVSGSTFTENEATNGGGIGVLGGSTAQISNSTFTDNSTTGVGGGGILNLGQLTVTGGRFIDNTAPVNGGAINTQNAGVTNLNSSTVTGNTSGSVGGGLSSLGTLNLSSTTVQNNTGAAGGGIAIGAGAPVVLRASYVTNNSPDNCNPLGSIRGCTH